MQALIDSFRVFLADRKGGAGIGTAIEYCVTSLVVLTTANKILPALANLYKGINTALNFQM